MMMEVYMMTLLTLCLVALVLALVLLMQGTAQQQSQPTQHNVTFEEYPHYLFARDVSHDHQHQHGSRKHATPASTGYSRAAKPLQLASPKPLTEVEQLSLVTSAFVGIRQHGSNASLLLAERTLPRLKDNTVRVHERLHMGRHRLQLIELSDDLKSATIARQTLRQLPRFEAHA